MLGCDLRIHLRDPLSKNNQKGVSKARQMRPLQKASVGRRQRLGTGAGWAPGVCNGAGDAGRAGQCAGTEEGLRRTGVRCPALLVSVQAASRSQQSRTIEGSGTGCWGRSRHEAETFVALR